VKIEASWYEKTALYAALKTALRAGTAPDIFYAEPDQVEYMENGLLLDLTPLKWSGIEPWARQIWTYQGKPYGLPLEAWTVELYYNKDMLKKLGIELPANAQFTQSQFLDLVKKARAAGMTPIAQGVRCRAGPRACRDSRRARRGSARRRWWAGAPARPSRRGRPASSRS